MMTMIQRHNGNIIDLNKVGIRTKDIIISSPTPVHYFEEMEGVDGTVDYGTDYDTREITGRFRLISKDYLDFALYRDEVFHLFRSKESFYLIDIRQPSKRWLVKVADPFTIPRKGDYGDFEIDFIGLKGVSESIGTTQDIQHDGISAETELWGFGMGLQSLDETYIYSFNAKENEQFGVYNAGNILVHPFRHDLKITISDVIGSKNKLELKNSNSTLFRIDEEVDKDQKIVLDGPNITTNGTVIDPRTTNRGLIQLNPEWNWFTIKGADSAKVSFDFRFYYY